MQRRDFLQLSALPLLPQGSSAQKKSCILLMLTGGPSQLDTWDMKPEAPVEVRGPFRPIRTNVPGIEISEIFPRMARHAHQFALIRSVHYDGPAVHATGHQLMQTGSVSSDGVEYPHAGCVISKLTGSSHAMLPGTVINTGGTMSHGQTAGCLGLEFEPVAGGALKPEPHSLREEYGLNAFGQNCLRARRLVEAGTRFVTVNMFDTIFGQPTWDSHGTKAFSSMADYRDTVGPMFDNAYSSLLEDLGRRGLLESTLVVGMGEFGRSPRINPAGGRDHWPQCWTIHMAGGGIRGGQVYGSSDRFGGEPRDQPVTPQMVLATIYRAFNFRFQGAEPIHALFA